MNHQNMNTLINHLKWLKETGKEHKFNMWSFIGYLKEPHVEWGYSIESLLISLEQHDIKNPIISPYECDTTACIAGHAALIGGAQPHDDLEVFARNWLGLTDVEASDLFYFNLKASLEEAIDYLEEFAKNRQEGETLCGQ